MSMKNPLTPSGIEPATFRFIVQHLNHCAVVFNNFLIVPFVFDAETRCCLQCFCNSTKNIHCWKPWRNKVTTELSVPETLVLSMWRITHRRKKRITDRWNVHLRWSLPKIFLTHKNLNAYSPFPEETFVKYFKKKNYARNHVTTFMYF